MAKRAREEQRVVRFAIIGGGLMGKEAAASWARHFMFVAELPRPLLTYVADVEASVLEWWAALPGVKTTRDYHEALRAPDVDAVYVAVPHNLHERVYLDVIASVRRAAPWPRALTPPRASTYSPRSRSASTWPRA